MQENKKRKIKFPLILKDGVRVRTLIDLQTNFDMDKILSYYLEGKLEIWLGDRYEDEICEQVKELDTDKSDYAEQLCKILGVDEEYAKNAPPAQDVRERNDKRNEVFKLTDDRLVRINIENVAFGQEELDRILKSDTNIVYLTKGDYTFLPDKRNIKVQGIGESRDIKVRWNGHRQSEFDGVNMTFDNVYLTEYEERYERLKKITVDKNALKHSEAAAFSQKELDALINLGIKEVYLCGEKGKNFSLPKKAENVTVIGINKPKIDIKNEDMKVFRSRKVNFKDVVLPDEVIYGDYRIGSHVMFGEYGGQRLNWTVLDINEAAGTALILCHCIVNERKFTDPWMNRSNMKEWLEHEFMLQAFSKTEKIKIEDILILDEEQYKKYLNKGLISTISQSIIFRDTYLTGNVVYGSTIYKITGSQYFKYIGIRPALWVNLFQPTENATK